MRRIAGLLMLLAGSILSAEEMLPEIVARCGTMEIRREQAKQLMQGNTAPASSALDFRTLLKKRLTGYFCTELLKTMLEKEGFPLSAEKTEEELKALYAGYPAGFPRPSDGDIRRIAVDPFTQLQWSFRRYLLSRKPEYLQLPAEVVERYYREHQQEFLRPRQFSVTVYRSTDAAKLKLLQARIQQGMPPEKVRQEFADVEERILYRPVPEGTTLKAGDWTAPEPAGERYQICLIRAEHPAGYVTLEHASPLIREKLIRKLAAKALEQKLTAMLAEKKMEFYF